MESLKNFIEKFLQSLNFENDVLVKIEKAYLELAILLPKEDRARVKIKDLVKIKKTKSGESSIVKLNLGGNIFYNLESTLTKKIQKENCD